MKNTLRVALTLSLIMTAVSAHADWAFLNGKPGTVEFDYPCIGCVYANGGEPFAFTVPTVVNTNLDPGILFVQNTFSNTGIAIGFLWSDTFASGGFNGEVFTFTNAWVLGIAVSQICWQTFGSTENIFTWTGKGRRLIPQDTLTSTSIYGTAPNRQGNRMNGKSVP